jgi:hypothetical protein
MNNATSKKLYLAYKWSNTTVFSFTVETIRTSFYLSSYIQVNTKWLINEYRQEKLYVQTSVWLEVIKSSFQIRLKILS